MRTPIGRSENDRPSAGGVGHARELAGEVLGRGLVDRQAGLDHSTAPAAPGLLLHVDVLALESVRTSAAGQRVEHALDLEVDPVRREKRVRHRCTLSASGDFSS